MRWLYWDDCWDAQLKYKINWIEGNQAPVIEDEDEDEIDEEKKDIEKNGDKENQINQE